MPRQLIVVLVVASLGGFAGWMVNGWRLGEQHEQYRREQAELLAASERKVRNQERGYKLALANLDEFYFKELTSAEEENARLRADVLRGDIRLSVPATCPATAVPGNSATTGGAHAESRADIDERAAAEILSLTDRGDRAIRQLSALQQYVRTVCMVNN